MLDHTQVRREFALRDLSVADCGDASSEESLLDDIELTLMFSGFVTEVEIRPVLSDFHSAEAGEYIARSV